VPGRSCSDDASITVTLAGVSAAIFSTTVIEVLTGSGFGVSVGDWVWAASRNGQNIRTEKARM
jgi:hypothetical protein